MMLGNKFLYNNAYIFYIVGVILLILVLFLGKPINNARCWFIIPYIGSIQPSEFMKVFWIITLSRMINDFNEEYDNPEVSDELKFILKVLVLLLIPSILTYVEPDTGAVIMYLIITITMLFVGGFRKRWFVITILTIVALVGSILGIYFLDRDLFIKLFGTSFFYRMDRLVNLGDGYQINEAIKSISNSGLFGIKNYIYFPEAPTDFAFTLLIANFGYIGMSILLLSYFLLFKFILEYSYDDLSRCFVFTLMVQFCINIFMNIGLFPIMGITLPFISYGGSSILSYMFVLSFILNKNKA